MAGPRRGSLKRETRANCTRRLTFWRNAMRHLASRRAEGELSSALLLRAYRNYRKAQRNHTSFNIRKQLIGNTDFTDVFNGMSDEQCLLHFRFLRADLLRIVDIVVAGPRNYTTERNMYRSNALLGICVVLKRLSTPQRWADVEVLFRKHAPQLSEIFWEAVEGFVDRWEHLVTSPISSSHIAARGPYLAQKVKYKVSALPNCVGFIDGTVIEIARPDDSGLQNVCYNGHKRKHALKFQAVTLADGMFAHVYGPVEGRRHDWTLYARSELDGNLEVVLVVGGRQFCIYGDSGYNRRDYLEIPFQGSNLSPDQAAFNKAMSAARITVEWMFKEVKTFWTMVDFPRKMRVLQIPVGTLYKAAILLCNIRNCFYRNQTSLYFGCKPPTLEEYLRWNE